MKSIDDFLKDDRLYRYAMKAFGLDDMIYAEGLHEEGAEGGGNLLVLVCQHALGQPLPRVRPRLQLRPLRRADDEGHGNNQKVVDNYVRLAFEANSGSQNEGVRLALYFASKAPTSRAHSASSPTRPSFRLCRPRSTSRAP